MKKRVFALIIVIGFITFFTTNKHQSVVEDEQGQALAPIDTPVAQAAIMEEKGPLADIHITLDAGHGGYDSGAVGPAGTYEKDVTLETTILLKELLEEEGATIQLTRDQDQFRSLQSRTYVAATHRTNLFISIHADGFENPQVRGRTIYYYDDRGEDFATAIHEQISAADLGTPDRGADFGNYQVLRDTYIPSVLLELGYITNPEDEKLLNSQSYQVDISEKIVQGVVDYVEAQAADHDIPVDREKEHSLAGY